ncbi:hypothetical protein V5799_003210 [Amblyomma americanum]|uniref:Uncharacterized protein n=1 Tax=Amblyomma americanum TaxID=6943 RepID=A0AAQ4D9L4_AMBAM
MSNDVDSFDCDATITAIILALEELSLRQQRDAQLEREIGRLESKKYRLETRLEATNIKLQQLRRDAIRQESATLREFKREIALLEQDISKSKDDLRALEHQCSQLEAKCGALEKEKDELHRTADELNRRIEDIKLRDSDTAAKGFELRKLLQEVRFEVAQLEQELCELAEVERHARNRVDWLLSERGRWADGACRLEADNNALRLVSFAGALSCKPFHKVMSIGGLCHNGHWAGL